MATIVTGDLYEDLDGLLVEIKRQIRQKGGYGFDPELLRKHLQAGIEGRFVGSDTRLIKSSSFKNAYFAPIHDLEVPGEYSETVVKYRTIARAWDIRDSVAICYRVRAGFTLKQHAPKFGKCYKDFKYQRDWNFVDGPTMNCFIFWVPCVVPGSVSKTFDEQMRLLAKIRAKYKLPAHHLANLGEVAENAGLILAHKKATGGVLIPFGCKWVRTATFDARRSRLSLGCHDASGLDCDRRYFDVDRNDDLGVFARGVEILGQ
ncbi:MAG TPA: hypothetical protein PLV72_00715 [Candidatus Magasanikbacteria bacterium]|nr:hypothetical protein [Candidatus Magasanikbacteria bacterium]